MQTQENKQYAGFFVRLAAYTLDSLLVSIALLVITVPMGLVTLFNGPNIFTRPLLFQYSAYAIFLYLIRAFYFAVCTYSSGRTIGKKLMNIKVISTDEQEKLTFVNALYRETIGRFLSGLILYVGYIILGPDKEKKALHDILCDTRVIYSVSIRQDIRTVQMPPVNPVMQGPYGGNYQPPYQNPYPDPGQNSGETAPKKETTNPENM